MESSPGCCVTQAQSRAQNGHIVFVSHCWSAPVGWARSPRCAACGAPDVGKSMRKSMGRFNGKWWQMPWGHDSNPGTGSEEHLEETPHDGSRKDWCYFLADIQNPPSDRQRCMMVPSKKQYPKVDGSAQNTNFVGQTVSQSLSYTRCCSPNHVCWLQTNLL